MRSTVGAMMKNYLIGLALFVVFLFAGGGRAQVAVSVEEQLALAQICVNEGDFRVHTRPDCPAIFEALANFARQRTVTERRACVADGRPAEECAAVEITWLEHARVHSDRVFDRGRTDARRYIAWLNPAGTEPRGWPTMAFRRDGTSVRVLRHVGWDRRREDWLAVYALAGRILSGEVRAHCDGTPLTWGCPGEGRRDCGDHARAVERGLIRVDCGETSNWFYGRP